MKKYITTIMAVLLLTVLSVGAYASNERPLVVKPVFITHQMNITFYVWVNGPGPNGGQCYTVTYSITGGLSWHLNNGAPCERTGSHIVLTELRMDVPAEAELIMKQATCEYLASDPEYLGVPCP